MSKIGKINISIPDKVKVALAGNNLNIETLLIVNNKLEKYILNYLNEKIFYT